MHVVADIGNEYHRNADSMDAGGYRGVLLVESAGEIEHRDVAVGQFGEDRKRNLFSSLMVGAPGFQGASERPRVPGDTLSANGGVRL